MTLFTKKRINKVGMNMPIDCYILIKQSVVVIFFSSHLMDNFSKNILTIFFYKNYIMQFVKYKRKLY